MMLCYVDIVLHNCRFSLWACVGFHVSYVYAVP